MPGAAADQSRTGLQGQVLAVADDYPYAFCVGLFRPRIYISTGLAHGLDQGELRAVLAHERGHLLNRDPLRLLVARVAKRALLLLPLTGEVYRRYLLGRELTADREALATVTREELASALLKLLRGHGRPLVDAEGAAGFNIIEEPHKIHGGTVRDVSSPALLAVGHRPGDAGHRRDAFGLQFPRRGQRGFGLRLPDLGRRPQR